MTSLAQLYSEVFANGPGVGMWTYQQCNFMTSQVWNMMKIVLTNQTLVERRIVYA